MHSEILRSDKDFDNFPYSYLLEWEWPEHIELLLRRVIWSRLVELTKESDETINTQSPDPSDHLAAKLCWLIAISPETHPAVLDVLASIDSAAYAERIAENPRAAASTLARLAGHSCAKVRWAVAENQNTPIEVLSILVNDQDADVRYTMAENHQLPEAILLTLSEDENCYVSSRAQRTLNRLAPPRLATMPLQRTQRAVETLRQASRA